LWTLFGDLDLSCGAWKARYIESFNIGLVEMNLEESLERRISSILDEVERRGFKAIVFMNEVIGLNPSNFVYVSGPWGFAISTGGPRW
jgi:hypothetical protein